MPMQRTNMKLTQEKGFSFALPMNNSRKQLTTRYCSRETIATDWSRGGSMSAGV